MCLSCRVEDEWWYCSAAAADDDDDDDGGGNGDDKKRKCGWVWVQLLIPALLYIQADGERADRRTCSPITQPSDATKRFKTSFQWQVLNLYSTLTILYMAELTWAHATAPASWVDACHDVSNFKLRARTFPKAGHNFTLNPSRENYLWLNILPAVSPLQTTSLFSTSISFAFTLSANLKWGIDNGQGKETETERKR